MATDDMVLVQEYARAHSEQAFETLVSRHINLVYSVAFRQVRDAHLAQEVTQAVPIVLERKARTLGPKTILSGWLCRTARYVAANVLTIERRRRHREQEAYMQSHSTEPQSNAWMQIEPMLETAMAQLGEKDHSAIVLRYFEGRSFGEVSAALGTSEDAAKKRREAGRGKAEGIPGKTRAHAFGGSDCRRDFGKFHSSRSNRAGDLRHGRRRQRDHCDVLNVNPHQNHTENYGMDKIQGGCGRWHHCVAPRRHRRARHPHR